MQVVYKDDIIINRVQTNLILMGQDKGDNNGEENDDSKYCRELRKD